MPALQRLTTEYIEREDRVRISGEAGNGELHSFWLTQRILSRLIPYLLSAIEEAPASSESRSIADERTHALFNEMAQQFAEQQIPEQPPVIDPDLNQSWLVVEVDVSKVDAHIRLGFKNSDYPLTELLLDQNQLRQWLSILFNLWRKAEWPLVFWPEWMLNSTNKTATSTKSAMH